MYRTAVSTHAQALQKEAPAINTIRRVGNYAIPGNSVRQVAQLHQKAMIPTETTLYYVASSALYETQALCTTVWRASTAQKRTTYKEVELIPLNASSNCAKALQQNHANEAWTELKMTAPPEDPDCEALATT